MDFLRSLALVLLVLAITGCGRRDPNRPELGYVQGTVTLDGKPIHNAAVGFYPLSGGETSVSLIDREGHYDLAIVDGDRGAETGMSDVKVFWPEGWSPTAKIPEKYNAKSELQFEVKPGNNTYDIVMESK